MREVELAAGDGTALRGRLYVPRGVIAGSAPGVVMSHGFSATVDMALDDYARLMCDAGLVVLAYDHRHLGASDGEPRRVINPWRQTRDQIDAIGWLAARPEVDGARIGVWGSSYSGGQVLVLGAVDPRVKAVVANVPFVGLFEGEGTADERYAALRDALLDDSGAGPADATEDPVGPFAVVTEEGAAARVFLPQPESAEWFLDRGRRPGVRWENEVWLRRAFGAVPAFDPGVAIPHLHAPLLMIVATEDDVAGTETELRAFALAPEPKELLTIAGHHFTPYAGEPLAVAAGAAARWFTRWL
jgi:pimeloyl-ACP methyl ester carboxylesterase